jgi:hypothetical protein
MMKNLKVNKCRGRWAVFTDKGNRVSALFQHKNQAVTALRKLEAETIEPEAAAEAVNGNEAQPAEAESGENSVNEEKSSFFGLKNIF